MNKRFFTIGEISEYLGFSQSAVRKWIRSGEIPYCRINGGIRFDILKIEPWALRRAGK